MVRASTLRDAVSRAARPEDPWAYGVYALVVAALFVFFLLPPLLVSPSGLTKAERLKAENDLRTTGVQLLAGFVLVVGSYFTARTLRQNRESQITERFTRAIDQLGNANLDVRVGGIFALERIAKDSPVDRAAIAEVLTAFLRGHSPRGDGGAAETASPAETARPPADIQAAVTVTGRRVWFSGEDEALFLAGVELRGADLRYAHLDGAFLDDSDLAAANLRGASLQGVNAFGAVFTRAVLIDARLDGAFLRAADLEGANLRDAKLPRANLAGARLVRATLSGTDLESADLQKARLDSASLRGAVLRKANLGSAVLRGASLKGAVLVEANLGSAQLERAFLSGADLSGANLRSANLTAANLDGANLQRVNLDEAVLTGARCDDATKWPDGFDRSRLAES